MFLELLSRELIQVQELRDKLFTQTYLEEFV